MSRSKLDLFSDKTDCLGPVIDDNGIHAELDKMQQIREWIIPQNYNEVQKFLELVQYLALYMPDIMVYTTPLSGLAQITEPSSGHRYWINDFKALRQ